MFLSRPDISKPSLGEKIHGKHSVQTHVSSAASSYGEVPVRARNSVAVEKVFRARVRFSCAQLGWGKLLSKPVFIKRNRRLKKVL